MSLMPCFELPNQAPTEGTLVGRILAGYGELELTMCACLIAIEGQVDLPIRKLFDERGAENRIKLARNILHQIMQKQVFLPICRKRWTRWTGAAGFVTSTRIATGTGRPTRAFVSSTLRNSLNNPHLYSPLRQTDMPWIWLS
jgi:hypothetical protein